MSAVRHLETLSFTNNNVVWQNLSLLSYRSGDLGAYLKDIVNGVGQLIQSNWSILTICRGDNVHVIASSKDMEKEDQCDDECFSLHGSLAGEVIQLGGSLIIEDSRNFHGHSSLAKEYRCYLGIPLITSTKQIIGTACSFFRHPRPFTESEVKVVQLFADRAATAIENYHLYQQQLQLNKKLIREVAAYSFNLELAQKKLIEQEQLAAIGEFTSMIVHEVRNPLTTIEMGLKYAQKVLHSEGDQKRLGLALSESNRLNHLLSEILSYAKPQVLHLTKLNIGEFLNGILEQIQDQPEACDRYINYVQESPQVEVMADIDKLRQVFLNLFRNAFEAIGPQETVNCTVTNEVLSDHVCIKVHNGGAPIPPELLSHIATPFYSTKTSGTGLGLATSKRIIIAHGGELDIASSILGTTVCVHLPIHKGEASH
jgi:signal transduction histidine kinase